MGTRALTEDEKLRRKVRKTLARPIDSFQGFERPIEAGRRRDLNRIANPGRARTTAAPIIKPKKKKTDGTQTGNLSQGVESVVDKLRRRGRL